MSTTTTAPGQTRTAHPRPLTDISAMVGREARRTLRSVDSLVTSLLIPVSIMVVFVVVFGGAIQGDGDYVGYVVPGTILLCAGFGAATTAVPVAQDQTSGTIARLKTLPVYGPAVLVGHVVASVVRNLVSTTFVVAVAVALGFRPGANALGWVAVVLFLVLAVTALTWIACAAGLVLSVEAAGALSFVALFLPYLSSGFVPVETLPSWLHGFATHQPSTPIIETLRALLDGTDPTGTLLPALVWLVGLGTVGFLASTSLHRRRA